MKLPKYEIIASNSALSFEFTSVGKNGAVQKLVLYEQTDLPNVLNLGFGDKHPTTGEIDDLVITDNGDSEKVLATVAATGKNLYQMPIM